ncbi:MAG: helix-turn-helix domain-containing protein [Ruminococcaceae bacterium]|nr:helix-turn-helix domain-containing protein [Oscillospiraceae bacterium]
MERIIKYFQYLNDQYDIRITIKDFAHLLFKNRHFAAFRRFEDHDNGYCAYIKSIGSAQLHCVEASNIELYNKIATAKDPHAPFWGVCHCGVKEYVIPIVANHLVLGAVLVGQYPCEAKRMNSTFDRISAKYDCDRGQLETLYNRSFAHAEPPREGLLAVLGVCADYIAECLSEFAVVGNPMKSGGDEKLINTAISYITANLSRGRISLSDIAKDCHCSESTLSHCFRKSRGISIGQYILRRRVSRGKKLLLGSDLSISVIAEKCGFGSSEHFSNAFKRLVGVSPANYRYQLQEKSKENM